jgi:hypothetical protein
MAHNISNNNVVTFKLPELYGSDDEIDEYEEEIDASVFEVIVAYADGKKKPYRNLPSMCFFIGPVVSCNYELISSCFICYFSCVQLYV